ncbi:MAG: hypothetical protein V7754_19525 [Halioglobus sp.]
MKRLINTLFLLLLTPTSLLHADALMVNQSMRAPSVAEFFITKDGVEVKLEIGVKGSETFKNLLPGSIYSALGFGERPAEERRIEFFKRQMMLIDENRQPLVGKLIEIGPSKRILRDPFNGTPLPIQDEAPEVIRAVLKFAFNGDTLPERLSFIAPAYQSIGFIAYHKGVAINDFRYLLSGYSLKLDWNDPWYSAFEGRKLQRQNFAPMSGFIYIEPFEVRKEIIVRPKDLQRWVDLGLEGKRVITVAMQARIKEKVSAFLAQHHPVFIDDIPVEGVFESINFLERTMSSSRVIDSPEPLDIDAAILGTIFVYPQSTLPKKVVMTWDLWDERIQSVPTSAVDQEGPFISILEPDWPRLEWINFLKYPFIPTLHAVKEPASPSQVLLAKSFPICVLLTLLTLAWLAYSFKHKQSRLLAASLSSIFLAASVATAQLGKSNNPEQASAEAIVGALLHNIYRSFDYREEGDIYDVLATSVSGELLTDIFLETKRSLVLANQGGAAAKVKNVVLESVEIQPDSTQGSFSVNADWTVNGSVGHWGHIHKRSNRYLAELIIVVDGDQWKLQEMSVLQEERL